MHCSQLVRGRSPGRSRYEWSILAVACAGLLWFPAVGLRADDKLVPEATEANCDSADGCATSPYDYGLGSADGQGYGDLQGAGAGGYGGAGALDIGNLGAAGLAMGSQAALPFMNGDSAAGCGVVTVGGLNATIGHPNFGCNRLNLAENGSPMLRDRFFFSYRHFSMATYTDIFSSPGIDNSAFIDVDRFILGFERTFFDELMSVEVRLPFNYQLDSLIHLSNIWGTTTNVPVDEKDLKLGNLDLIFKFLMRQTQTSTWTAGVGLALPTSPNVQITANAHYIDPILAVPIDADIFSLIANDTVYMTPFVGWAIAPQAKRWFNQGFVQLDLPLNPTRAVLGIDGGPAGVAQLDMQTLMRVNTQLGYWLYRSQNPRCSHIDRIAALFEVNWTGTLEKADQASFDLGMIGGQPVDLTLGSPFQRMDVVNLVFGTAIQGDRSDLNLGIVTPMVSGEKKPFDWELVANWNIRF